MYTSYYQKYFSSLNEYGEDQQNLKVGMDFDEGDIFVVERGNRTSIPHKVTFDRSFESLVFRAERIEGPLVIGKYISNLSKIDSPFISKDELKIFNAHEYVLRDYKNYILNNYPNTTELTRFNESIEYNTLNEQFVVFGSLKIDQTYHIYRYFAVVKGSKINTDTLDFPGDYLYNRSYHEKVFEKIAYKNCRNDGKHILVAKPVFSNHKSIHNDSIKHIPIDDYILMNVSNEFVKILGIKD